MDQEPGRCRRTDGKKWRCSRDVLPDQKYCESHMHRGRQRSRKLVETTKNVKKSNSPKIFNSNNIPITINHPESAKKISNSSTQIPTILQPIHHPSPDTSYNVFSATPATTISPIVYNRRKGNVKVKNECSAGSTTYITTFSDSNESLKIKKISKNILSNSKSSTVAPGSDTPSKGVLQSGFGCDTSSGALTETPLTQTEPQRCRRTDGRKWRCSSIVLPDHKYCVQHINRGKKKLTTPSNHMPISSFPPLPSIPRNSNIGHSVPQISTQRTMHIDNETSSTSGSSSDATTITDDENTSDSSKYIIRARTSNLQTPFGCYT